MGTGDFTVSLWVNFKDSTRQQVLASQGGYCTGTGWVLEHLQGHLLGPDDGDPNQSIDEVLTTLLEQSPWPGRLRTPW